MNDNSKFKLGLFIIFAAIVFFAALFILGTMDRFNEKAHISTLVSESVQGLSVGSSVKYQGVPIGSVREIMIYPGDNVIRIDMEINISKFKVQQPGHAPITISVDEFNSNIGKAVEKGLRCRMELEGITGSKYIDAGGRAEFHLGRKAPRAHLPPSAQLSWHLLHSLAGGLW